MKMLCYKYLIRIGIALSFATFVFAAEGTTTYATEAEVVTDVRIIQVNGLDVSIDLEYANQTWYSIRSLTTEFPNTFTMTNLAEYDIYLNGELVENDATVEITLEQLAPNIGIEFRLIDKVTGEEKHYFIRTLHAAFDLTVGDTSEDLVDGYYYFTQGNMMYKMDTAGNVVYYKRGNLQFTDFKPYEIDGELYYSYLEDVDPSNYLEATGESQAVIMNANYEIVDTIPYLSTANGIAENQPLSSYDFIMLDLGHYIITGNMNTNVNNIPTDVDDDSSAYVTATVIQEIKDNELLFQWISTDYPEFYGLSVEGNDYASEEAQNYLHFNSIDIDPSDDNFVVSFCNLDSVVKIDRETGEPLWILGGLGDEFSLTDEQLFSRQHYAKFSDEGVLTLYDNGTANVQTRALQIVLDEDRKTVIDYVDYSILYKYTESMGSASCINSDEEIYLMGWGSRSPDCNLFSEINFETGEVLFELYDVTEDVGGSTYRVYKYDK
ncbi:MAG: arylsulfotransferase family protein [Eubacteriales bacterium]